MSNVDHPNHYGGDTPFETIKVMEAWFGPEVTADFCVLSATKYLSRAHRRTGAAAASHTKRIEDLRKAEWYSKRAADLLERVEPIDVRTDLETASLEEFLRESFPGQGLGGETTVALAERMLRKLLDEGAHERLVGESLLADARARGFKVARSRRNPKR